jgi:hypothetical protein
MDYNTGKPNHIEDVLIRLHTGQWFGWSDSKNKIYDNLIIHHSDKEKPTEEFLNNKLLEIQEEFENRITQEKARKESAIAKLKALGLTEEEVKSIL